MKIKLIIIGLLLWSSSFAQKGKKSIDATFKAYKSIDNVTFLEVSDEMFCMLAEADHTPPELRAYYKQLDSLKMLELRGQQGDPVQSLYQKFLADTDLEGFSRLMVAESAGDNMSFLKNKSGSNKNEFLLVSDNAVIYVAGEIDLKSIQEFQRVLAIAGTAMAGH